MFTVKEIVEVTGGNLICGNQDIQVFNFCNDTRQLKEKDMYVGIKGERVDGSDFAGNAFENGAIGVIVDKEEVTEGLKGYNGIVILVKDSIQAIQTLAKYKRDMYDVPVIAITGSVGKTSTKEIISSVVSKKYKVLKTEGNFNSVIGLPLMLLKLEEHNAMVLEMGMNHFKEIETMSKIARPTISVITNIGSSHIGILGSRENILKAKLEILEGMEDESTLVINSDNDLLNMWNSGNLENGINKKCHVKTYGIENTSNYMAKDINIDENGTEYKIQIDGSEYNVRVPIGGNHFVYNSLSGIAVGKLLDIPISDILEGIKEFELVERRMDIQKIKENITVVNDSYNASFESIKPILEYLKVLKSNRKIAVLGDIFELGEHAKNIHENIGELVVDNNIDILVTVGTDAKYIAARAKELGMNREHVCVCDDNKEAIEVLNKIMKPQDVVLLKASNGMNFEEILQGIK